MTKYGNSKIYKIVSPQTDKIYIGSTTKTYLCQRMATHRSNYRKYLLGQHHYISVYEILKYGDSKIILLECFPCNSSDELRAKEQEYITMLGDLVVNKNNACGINIDKRNSTMNRYKEDNKDKISEYQKEYQREYRKIKYKCKCGMEVSMGSKACHEKSTTHHMLLQIISDAMNLPTENAE